MAYKLEDWNNLLDQVNDVITNPPEDTDCEDIEIDPIPHVGPDHKWSKADIQEVHDKLCQTCDDISFEPIPTRWKTSIITEIEDAMDEAWCECEEGPGIFCTPEIIAWEESRDGSVLFNMPYCVIKDYDQGNDPIVAIEVFTGSLNGFYGNGFTGRVLTGRLIGKWVVGGETFFDITVVTTPIPCDGFVSGVADSVVVPMNPYIYSGQLNITTPVIYTSGTCVEECPG